MDSKSSTAEEGSQMLVLSVLVPAGDADLGEGGSDPLTDPWLGYILSVLERIEAADEMDLGV